MSFCRPHTPESRERISRSMRGRTPKNLGLITSNKTGAGNPNFGRKETAEQTESRISKCRGQKRSFEFRMAASLRMRGDRSPWWKGGVTETNKRLRKSVEFKVWRESVFNRDDFTCRKCLTRGAVIHPHHIASFHNNPTLRFEIENGATLCEECHDRFHSEFGSDCNSLMFRQFIGGPSV